MILVEVSAPALGRCYDFELEEIAALELLIPEIVEVICRREHLQAFDRAQPFGLYSQDDACRLDPAGSLRQNGVQNGQKLILL